MPKNKQINQVIDANHRLRTTIEFDLGAISHWAVQLEMCSPEDNWQWVTRYDTAGGKAHRDRHLIAVHEEIAIPKEASQAIDFAQQDLRKHYMEYTQAYLEAKKSEEKGER